MNTFCQLNWCYIQFFDQSFVNVMLRKFKKINKTNDNKRRCVEELELCLFDSDLKFSPSETYASEFLVECLTRRRNWVTMLSKHLLGVQSFGLLNIGYIWLEIGSNRFWKKKKILEWNARKRFACENILKFTQYFTSGSAFHSCVIAFWLIQNFAWRNKKKFVFYATNSDRPNKQSQWIYMIMCVYVRFFWCVLLCVRCCLRSRSDKKFNGSTAIDGEVNRRKMSMNFRVVFFFDLWLLMENLSFW